MNFSFSPRSFVEALEFLHWWESLAIAFSFWVIIWVLEGYPPKQVYTAAIPKHPVFACIAIFATVWGLFTFVNDKYGAWRLRQPRKKGSKDVW